MFVGAGKFFLRTRQICTPYSEYFVPRANWNSIFAAVNCDSICDSIVQYITVQYNHPNPPSFDTLFQVFTLQLLLLLLLLCAASDGCSSSPHRRLDRPLAIAAVGVERTDGLPSSDLSGQTWRQFCACLVSHGVCGPCFPTRCVPDSIN